MNRYRSGSSARRDRGPHQRATLPAGVPVVELDVAHVVDLRAAELELLEPWVTGMCGGLAACQHRRVERSAPSRTRRLNAVSRIQRSTGGRLQVAPANAADSSGGASGRCFWASLTALPSCTAAVDLPELATGLTHRFRTEGERSTQRRGCRLTEGWETGRAEPDGQLTCGRSADARMAWEPALSSVPMAARPSQASDLSSRSRATQWRVIPFGFAWRLSLPKIHPQTHVRRPS
jgi:hypothetical protein